MKSLLRGRIRKNWWPRSLVDRFIYVIDDEDPTKCRLELFEKVQHPRVHVIRDGQDRRRNLSKDLPLLVTADEVDEQNVWS